LEYTGEENMPKISTHAGATIEDSPEHQPEVTHIDGEPVSERSEEPSGGESLSRPLEVSESKEEIQTEPVPMTESLTPEQPAELSTVDSVDTSQSDEADRTTRRRSSRHY
jgi:hypothetical protein